MHHSYLCTSLYYEGSGIKSNTNNDFAKPLLKWKSSISKMCLPVKVTFSDQNISEGSTIVDNTDSDYGETFSWNEIQVPGVLFCIYQS